MSPDALMILTAALFLLLAAGIFYLAMRRFSRAKNGEDVRLENLTEELMQKLESKSLSEQQKAKISEALREIRGR